MSMISDLILVAEPFALEAPNASPIIKAAIKFKIMQIDKKRFTFFIISCVVVFLIALQATGNLNASEIIGFNRNLKNYNAKLQIFDRNSNRVAFFKVAVAKSDEQKMYGLMNLKQLPKEYGMLFPFKETQVITMWMKNTEIPLDMIFIDDDNEIATIKNNAQPNSLEIISSEKEVKYVLEINGGLAKELGIKVRQKVQILN